MKDLKDKNRKPTTVGSQLESVETGQLTLATEESETELSALSNEEQQLRDKCEVAVKGALHDVGYHLHVIKTKKLFRSTHQSFEKYCNEVFGISRVHANRKIEYHLTIELLKSEPRGSVSVPQSEAHSRQLTGLTQEQKVEVAKKIKIAKGEQVPTKQDWKDAIKSVVPNKVEDMKDLIGGSSVTPASEEKLILMPKSILGNQKGFTTPSEFHGLAVPSLKELNDKAKRASLIRGDSLRKQEFELNVCFVNKWLQYYAEWEAADYGANPKQEAA